MDIFSELITVVRMSVSIYHNAMICGNWQLEAQANSKTSFHIVTVGDCTLRLDDQSEFLLSTGDLVIFPKELSHSIHPSSPLVGPQQHIPYESHSMHEGTGLLCGMFRFHTTAGSKILDSLPKVLVIPCKDNQDWLSPIIELIIHESRFNDLASNFLLDKLCEILFIKALRFYLQQNTEKIGLLRLYSHPKLSKLLQSLHQHPEFEWTLDLMAKEAAQSRTQFVNTFKSASGYTPMHYLTWLRMQQAWRYIEEGMPIAHVAEKVGYQSETAFMRAFKKEFSMTTGDLKRKTALK